MGTEDDQLLAIQNDLRKRLKARDEARERTVSNKLHELEQKHEFANAQFLKHFAQVSELLEPTAKDAQAKENWLIKCLCYQHCSTVKRQRLIMKDSISILDSKLKKVI